MQENVIFEPEFGLEGTIPELVDFANRYTSDYSDPALERISELARIYSTNPKHVEIPLLLRNERKYEGNGTLKSAYARLQIEHYLGNKISLCMSNYGEDGRELEVYEQAESVVIHLNGTDEQGVWNASNIYTMEEFMSGAANWLDQAVGETLFYSKQYDEEEA